MLLDVCLLVVGKEGRNDDAGRHQRPAVNHREKETLKPVQRMEKHDGAQPPKDANTYNYMAEEDGSAINSPEPVHFLAHRWTTQARTAYIGRPNQLNELST